VTSQLSVRLDPRVNQDHRSGCGVIERTSGGSTSLESVAGAFVAHRERGRGMNRGYTISPSAASRCSGFPSGGRHNPAALFFFSGHPAVRPRDDYMRVWSMFRTAGARGADQGQRSRRALARFPGERRGVAGDHGGFLMHRPIATAT